MALFKNRIGYLLFVAIAAAIYSPSASSQESPKYIGITPAPNMSLPEHFSYSSPFLDKFRESPPPDMCAAAAEAEAEIERGGTVHIFVGPGLNQVLRKDYPFVGGVVLGYKHDGRSYMSDGCTVGLHPVPRDSEGRELPHLRYPKCTSICNFAKSPARKEGIDVQTAESFNPIVEESSAKAL